MGSAPRPRQPDSASYRFADVDTTFVNTTPTARAFMVNGDKTAQTDIYEDAEVTLGDATTVTFGVKIGNIIPLANRGVTAGTLSVTYFW
jgi:hypothetical protein